MSKCDYYEVLGVVCIVIDDELKKVYCCCVMKFYLDCNLGDVVVEVFFKECKEVYEVLFDGNKCCMYDSYGYVVFEYGMGGGGLGGLDMNDIFGDIFGNIFGGGGGGLCQVCCGVDIGYVMELDLEEVVCGIECWIEILILVECGDCDGSGFEDGKVEICNVCYGRGQVCIQCGIFVMQQVCYNCGGCGQIIVKFCKICYGNGCVEEDKVLLVKVLVGVDIGDCICLQGEGEVGLVGMLLGDLYVEVCVCEYVIFQCDGDDLYCEVLICILQVVLGDIVCVVMFGGEVEICILVEIQIGKLFCLCGKGVCLVCSCSEGDLYCCVVVEMLVNFINEQCKLLEQFEVIFVGEEVCKYLLKLVIFIDGVKGFWDWMMF